MKYLTDFEKTFSNFVFNLWKELKVLDMKNPNNPALRWDMNLNKNFQYRNF